MYGLVHEFTVGMGTTEICDIKGIIGGFYEQPIGVKKILIKGESKGGSSLTLAYHGKEYDLNICTIPSTFMELEFPIIDGKSPYSFAVTNPSTNVSLNLTILVEEIGGIPSLDYAF